MIWKWYHYLGVGAALSLVGFWMKRQVDVSSYRTLADQAAALYGVPTWLILAIMKAESNFRSHAFRPEPEHFRRYRDSLVAADPRWAVYKEHEWGSYGLMQLMPPTAARFGFAPSTTLARLYEPTLNVSLGTAYLAFLAGRFGNDWRRVIMAYNAGEGAVDRNEIPISTVTVYLPRVTVNIREYGGPEIT